jgi:hypothetical protein
VAVNLNGATVYFSLPFRMPFTLPDTFKDKDLTDNTKRIYKSKLNALARAGYDTTDALMANKKEVIEMIKKVAPGDDTAARQKKRTFLAAIFWVLPGIPARNPYHTFWQKVLPTEVVSSDDAWEPAKKYKERLRKGET